jgi:hypothetical protein
MIFICAIENNRERRMRALVSVFFLFLVSSKSVFAEDIRLCSSLGDKGIETLQWSLGIIDERLPKVPPQEVKALDELEARTLSLGLDGVEPPELLQARRDAKERGYYYLRRARLRLKEAQDGAGYILVNAQSAAAYSASHGKWPHIFYPAQYEDAEAVKLEHASYELGALERMELALTEFLLEDEQRKDPLLSPASNADIYSRSSGYVALLGSYVSCKLNGVITAKKATR